MVKKLHFRSSLLIFLKLIRVVNLLILAFTQYMCAIFLVGPRHQWQEIVFDFQFFCLVLSTCIIAAAGYIINDYYDIKIDIINKPKRVIIGKMLNRRIAIFTHTAFNLFGILIALMAGLKIGIIAFVSAYFLWFYSNSLKRLPLAGNLIVSILTALSVWLVGLFFNRNLELILIFSVFAFFISLIREIIKDMEDLKGDAAFGCQTLPLVLGIRRTKMVLYFIIAIFLPFLAYWGPKVNLLLNFYFILFIVIPIIYLIFKTIKSDSSKDFHFLSIWCKFIMLSGVLSMLFI